jgi:hypothetical protein
MWTWRDENNNINIPAARRLLEAYLQAPPLTGDFDDPRFWLSMAFGELLKELEELRTGVKPPTVDRNSTTVPDGQRRTVSEIDLLRRVAAVARGYLNASSAKLSSHRFTYLENIVKEYEHAYPAPDTVFAESPAAGE